MQPIEFEEQNCVFAKDQPQYNPLPVHKDEYGVVISCWKFSFWERLKVLLLGRMWFHMYTFNKPLQPLLPTLEFPFSGEDWKNNSSIHEPQDKEEDHEK